MGTQAEKAKISIRNIRREANDDLKKDLKDKKIGEDDLKKFGKKKFKTQQINKYQN